MSYKISKKVPDSFHNGSTYDYHFIIKELAKEFQEQFECLGENPEKYITFSVPINKNVTETDKDNIEKTKTIFYKLNSIGSFRYMSTSLPNLIINLSERLHSDICADCKSCLDYMPVKDNQWNCIQLVFKCLSCNKTHIKDFNKNLINRISNTMETLINLFCC